MSAPEVPAARPGVVAGTGTDFAAIRRLRATVATRLGQLDSGDDAPGQVLSGVDEQVRARGVIAEEIERWITARTAEGYAAPSLEAERALADAVYAALFGLGSLQPLLDRGDVENIHIHGCDQVALELASGEIEWWPHPVAESDSALVSDLAAYAARLGQTSREFSSANPVLNLRLPAGGVLGARLAAVTEVAGRPHVAIRRHRLTDVTLTELVSNGTCDQAVAALLRAAVLARKNLIVTGGPAAGKTTLLRALANEIPADEHVVTVEDEYELGLHLMPARHRLVTALEARYPNSEGAGGIVMETLLTQSLRHSPSRVLVGEVRAGEVTAMLRALGNGAAGGMCTLHAASAHAVFDRIAALAQLSDPPLPIDAAHRWTAAAIDLVVHIRKVDLFGDRRRVRRERFVAEVLSVGDVGEFGRPETTTVFAPGPDGHAIPAYPPSEGLLVELERAGFDRGWLRRPGTDLDDTLGWTP